MPNATTIFLILASLLTVSTVGCGSDLAESAAPDPLAADASATVCGFDGRGFATAHGAGLYGDPSSGRRDLTEPVGANAAGTFHVGTTADLCVSSSASDPLSVAERTLIESFGCSNPYYFEVFGSILATPATDPANGSACVLGVDPWRCWPDKANGYPQLCPYSAGLLAYVRGLGILTNASGQASDLAAHLAGDRGLTFDAASLVPSPELGATPSAPAGFVWVIPWEDPHACAGGCMLSI